MRWSEVGQPFELDAPMEEDDDGVRALAGAPDLLEQPRDGLRGGEARLRRPGGPALDEVVVQDLRRGEDRDALSPHGLPVRRVCLLAVEPDADDREAVAPRSRERVAQARLSEVHTVVVGHRRDVDRSAVERLERARRRAEGERLRGRGPAVRHRCLEVDHRDVGLVQDRLDGSEQSRGAGGKPRRENALEVDVPAESQDDRLAAPERPALGGRSCLAPPAAEHDDEHEDASEEEAGE